MVNPKVFCMMILAAVACLMVDTVAFSQNVMAYNPGPAVDEGAAEAENATMMTNQTAANGNITGGTNSTS